MISAKWPSPLLSWQRGSSDPAANGKPTASIPITRSESWSASKPCANWRKPQHLIMNGWGYSRQLCGEQIPFYGRILAVANTYARLVQQQGDQKDPAGVLRDMHSLVDRQFDRVCYDALVTSVTGAAGLESIPRRSRKAGTLTEREVEVLCLLAQGRSTPQIAQTLDISRKTVEHHLEHIYDKLGVTCRTAAVVYAVQQGLV